MIKNNSLQERVENSMLDLINNCYGRVFDIAEAQLGSSPNWSVVRRQLLNVLGERGLVGDVRVALCKEFKAGGGA